MDLKSIRVLMFASAFCAVSTLSHAENCRMYPQGPQRFACISQKNPGVSIRRERCKEESRAMGLLPGAGGRKALGQYVMSCMQHNR